VDTDNDGVADTTVIPYNSNSMDDPPEDYGNRCVDFGPGELLCGENLHSAVALAWCLAGSFVGAPSAVSALFGRP